MVLTRVNSIVCQSRSYSQNTSGASRGAHTLQHVKGKRSMVTTPSIQQADTHYPAQLAVCITPGRSSCTERWGNFLYYGVLCTRDTDVDCLGDSHIPMAQLPGYYIQ